MHEESNNRINEFIKTSEDKMGIKRTKLTESSKILKNDNNIINDIKQNNINENNNDNKTNNIFNQKIKDDNFVNISPKNDMIDNCFSKNKNYEKSCDIIDNEASKNNSSINKEADWHAELVKEHTNINNNDNDMFKNISSENNAIQLNKNTSNNLNITSINKNENLQNLNQNCQKQKQNNLFNSSNNNIFQNIHTDNKTNEITKQIISND